MRSDLTRVGYSSPVHWWNTGENVSPFHRWNSCWNLLTKLVKILVKHRWITSETASPAHWCTDGVVKSFNSQPYFHLFSKFRNRRLTTHDKCHRLCPPWMRGPENIVASSFETLCYRLSPSFLHLCEARAVHEVEEVAVVGAPVPHGRGAWPAVPLLTENSVGPRLVN